MKVYEDAREMFMTQGWADFIEAKQADILEARIENLQDEKAFWMAKGSLYILHQIVGYENYMKHMEDQHESKDI